MAAGEKPVSGATLDMLMFPHLFDLILANAPHASLLALRTASRSTRDKVDGVLARHLTIEITDPRFYDECEYLAPVHVGSPLGRVPLFMGWTTEEPSEPGDGARRRAALESVAKHTRVIDALGPVGDIQAEPLFTAMADGLTRRREDDRSWTYRNRGKDGWSRDPDSVYIDFPFLEVANHQHSRLLLGNLIGVFTTQPQVPSPLSRPFPGHSQDFEMQCAVQHLALTDDHLYDEGARAKLFYTLFQMRQRFQPPVITCFPHKLVLIVTLSTSLSYSLLLHEFGLCILIEAIFRGHMSRLETKTTIVNLVAEQGDMEKLRKTMRDELDRTYRPEGDPVFLDRVQRYLDENVTFISLDEFRATTSPEAFALFTENMGSSNPPMPALQPLPI